MKELMKSLIKIHQAEPTICRAFLNISKDSYPNTIYCTLNEDHTGDHIGSLKSLSFLNDVVNRFTEEEAGYISMNKKTICKGCGKPWPCPSIQAVLESSEKAGLYHQELDKEHKTRTAANPKTSEKKLRKLAEERNSKIKQNVALNKNVSESTLKKLFKEKDPEVKKAVLKSLNCPVSIIEDHLHTSPGSFEIVLAENPNTPSSILKKFYSTTANLPLKLTVLKNSNLSLEDLMEIYKSEKNNYYVKESLTKRLNTPAEIIFEIAFDPIAKISNAAKQHPNYSIEKFVEEFVQ